MMYKVSFIGIGEEYDSISLDSYIIRYSRSNRIIIF